MEATTFSALSENIKEYLTSEEDIEQNRAIRDDFLLSLEQFDFMLKLTMDAALKRFDVLQLLSRLSKIPNAGSLDLKKFALRIAIDKLWPMQSHLKKVDVLINRLGGRIPMVTANSTDTRQQVSLLHGIAKDILHKHHDFLEMFLTQKPMKNIDNRLRAPSVQNWLDSYLHMMGAESGGSMKRSQFLAKSSNVSKLNEAEKENILNFLVSYEDAVPMYWEIAENQYLVVRSELPEEQLQEIQQQRTQQQLPDLVEQYRAVQNEYISLFKERAHAIDIETGGDTLKIRDVVWDALGLNEVDRCVSAISLLIEKHAFFEMLKTDQRFKGIIGRELTVRYGQVARRTWNTDATTSVMLTVFWRLILESKLGFEEDRAAILADYFRKNLGKKESPIYLDLEKQKFLFRSVEYQNKKFSFAN